MVTEKINQAIEKITKEANEHEGKPDYKLFLNFSELVIENIKTDADAEAVLQDGKTLAGADKAVDEAARKYKVGNRAWIDPEEAHGVILKYFGLTAAPSASSGVIDITDLL
jgi:hypothetical protein